eukprot:GHVN01088496.1.p1 GENE.GHVN01088496.1~~GHVN01088496.1.p1  ORF type:complete len:400 (+),score=31.88 GHVN01088496.1:53-1201(+)
MDFYLLKDNIVFDLLIKVLYDSGNKKENRFRIFGCFDGRLLKLNLLDQICSFKENAEGVFFHLQALEMPSVARLFGSITTTVLDVVLPSGEKHRDVCADLKERFVFLRKRGRELFCIGPIYTFNILFRGIDKKGRALCEVKVGMEKCLFLSNNIPKMVEFHALLRETSKRTLLREIETKVSSANEFSDFEPDDEKRKLENKINTYYFQTERSLQMLKRLFSQSRPGESIEGMLRVYVSDALQPMLYIFLQVSCLKRRKYCQKTLLILKAAHAYFLWVHGLLKECSLPSPVAVDHIQNAADIFLLLVVTYKSFLKDCLYYDDDSGPKEKKLYEYIILALKKSFFHPPHSVVDSVRFKNIHTQRKTYFPLDSPIEKKGFVVSGI